MNTSDVRDKFLDFFISKKHLEARSSSLIPDSDSILLTNAGMVQMIDYLTEKKDPPSRRMCSVQKCFRSTDIDDIGLDGRHLTLFQMLGSWSFGDYFKKEACNLAYELLVDVYKLDKERLWVTVFKGENGIPEDNESIIYWQQLGIPKTRIVKLGWKDNFWASPGETGPCGPSTEIYYDTRIEGCTNPDCKPGCDCDRFLEIWNAGVFMEYFKDENGAYVPLHQKNVDTGAGLERLAAVLQGKSDVFELDSMKPIVNVISNECKIEYIGDGIKQVKILTDHIRSSVFLINDGLIPSNEKRGYILRKLLRRVFSIFFVYNNIDKEKLIPIIEKIIDINEDFYGPFSIEKIKDVFFAEFEKYRRVITQSSKKLDDIYRHNGIIGGEDIFTLQDSYGLQAENTIEIIKLKNIKYDESKWEEDFKNCLNTQRNRSKIGSEFTLGKDIEIDFVGTEKTDFIGYEKTYSKSKILKIKKYTGFAVLVFDKTPFFATSGGQESDKGVINTEKFTIDVFNVKKTKTGIYLHFVDLSTNEIDDKIYEGMDVILKIDEKNREKSSMNHTATHLLHFAIRNVFGQDATQRGSFLNSDGLRFDFKLDRLPTNDELKRIEDIVNEKIKGRNVVNIASTKYTEAIKGGAIGLFTNEYGEYVRVVSIGDDSFSKELCGGTHVENTSKLGQFKITKMENISSDVKRIRAVLL